MKIHSKKILKTFIAAVVVCCLTVSLGLSQAIIRQSQASDASQEYKLIFTLMFSVDELTFGTNSGFDVVSLQNGRYTNEIAQPMIPIRNIRIALPDSMRATSVQILDIQEQTIDGNYLIYPAQPAQRMDTPAGKIEFIPPDEDTYNSNDLYPTEYLELTGQNDLAGQSMCLITVYPLHYLPLEQKLTYTTTLTFSIEGTDGYISGDYLPTSFSSTNHALYQQMIQDMVINPDDVMLRSSQGSQPLGVGDGDYDYIIITQDSWVSAFQPLMDWKTRKGVPATIVTTNWIYNSGGYSGTNVEKIRAFVQDVYSNWGTVYVLLGGDIDVVPCHYRTFSSVDPDPVPNDCYYADFDADWVCEVHVGRASVTGPGSGTGQIGNFINKVLTYEKNPPLTDYAQKAGFYGFDLDSITEAEECKIDIDNSYIPASWTTTTVYDSQGGNHKTNVINAINAGQNLMNHADHSGPHYMGTGNVNHDLGLEDSDMEALTNGNKQSIFYSMGCDPAAYDESACIAEHFVRNSNGGGIAFIGNSRYGWYYAGSTDTLSMGYDIFFFRSIFEQGFYNLGAAFSDHKNDGYENDATYKYCYTELTLLGDPELPIWTMNPTTMTASFPNQISVGPSSFTVSVSSSKTPVNQALVCLWKGDEVYMTGLTNSAGQITFSISPSTQGTMYVTIRKHNYIPVEGTTLIMSGENSAPETPGQPTGPASGVINTEYTYTTSTTDVDNDQLYYKWSWGAEESDWIGPYTSGAEAQAAHAWSTAGSYTVKVKAKDIFGYETSWSTERPVIITALKPDLAIGTITGGLFEVSSEIQNIGEADATNVNWAIAITGGFMFSGQTQNGSITTLDADSRRVVSDSPVFGFGPVTITVSASADGLPIITKSIDGFVFICYVIV